jgi:hypothetical protein
VYGRDIIKRDAQDQSEIVMKYIAVSNIDMMEVLVTVTEQQVHQ